MKVLNLQCESRHIFEGWFASEDEFQSQLQRKLVQCPVCGSATVTKGLSAPRLNLGASTRREVSSAGPTAADVAAPVSERVPTLQATWLEMVRHVVAHTEDVGTAFADQARRMHHGEIPERPIRGQATSEERNALIDEGISVFALPIPESAKGPLH